MAPADLAQLADLLTQHESMTGSDVARELLGDQASWPRRFTKLLPRDYAAVLAAIEQARDGAGGEPDDDTVWSTIMEASHG
jgi:glutamate synthase (NADPH/NADH) large chain